jgi:hypothetical protein
MRIAKALRKYLLENEVGSIPKRKARTLAPHEQASAHMSAMLSSLLGAAQVQGDTRADEVGKPLTQDDVDTIADFAKYNEEQTPYEVW